MILYEQAMTMKLSDGVEWGIHCAVVLAGLAPGATLPGKALAELHGVSESYLLKHLKALVAANLLESEPGPRGGYRLARAAARITLFDVVQAIDGTEPAFRCTEIRQRGPNALEPRAYLRPCIINAAMLRAEQAWRMELGRTTLADIAQGVAETADPRVAARGAQWLVQNCRPALRERS
jgi:Rrf2 family protein